MKNKIISFVFSLLFLSHLGLISNYAQTISSVEYFSPPGQPFQVGSQETAVVNSTGLIYSAATTYGTRFAVIDPNINTPIAFIEAPAITGTSSIAYSQVNQTTNLIYYSGSGVNNILVMDGRPSSPTFNKLLPPLTFPGQLVRALAFDETRNLMYVATIGAATGNPTGQLITVNVNPGDSTFHQAISIVNMPAGIPAYGVAVNPATNKVYVSAGFISGANLANTGVYVLNRATQSFAKIPGTNSGASAIAVNSASNLVYGYGQSNNLYAIDGASDTLLTEISNVSISFSSENIVINQTTGRVYLGGTPLRVIDGNRTSPTFNTVIASIASGGFGVVVDESLNKIAVTTSSSISGTLIIDGATNTIATTIPAQISASDVALNPATNRIFVANQLFNVQHINLTNNSLVATIPTGADAGTGVVSPLNNLFYVARARDTTDIPFFDANGIAGTVSGLPHNYGRILSVVQNKTTNRIYAINTARNIDNTAAYPNFAAVINPATNSVIANVQIGSQCLDAGVNEATNKVYILCVGGGSAFPGGISVINGATNTHSTVDLSAFPLPANDLLFNGPIVANPITNKIYFKTNNQRVAGVINGATDVASPLPYTGVSNIAVNKTLNRIYLTTANSLHVLNGADNSEIANVPLSSTSSGNGLAVNETTGRIFVVNPNENTVTVINSNTNTIVGTVPTGDNPSRIAVNEADNRIYVANSNFTSGNYSLTFIDGNNLTVRRTLQLPLPVSSISVSPATKRIYISSISGIAAAVIVVSDTVAASSKPFDFDGDGKSDISVFRPSNGAWYIQQSQNGFTGVIFGAGNDLLVPADYDGDGKTDIAVFRPSNGSWYYLRSSDGSFSGVQWGQNGDIPLPGDFDGDGRADVNVFRPSNGFWYRLNSSNNQPVENAFGQNGDIPLSGDFNGDGKADLAVFRPAAGAWYIARATGVPAQNFDAVNFGFPSDIPTPADYDGDGKTDISVFRSLDGGWYRLNSSDGSFAGTLFGQNGDVPVAADYDGDGRTDIAVFRPTVGAWYRLNSSNGGFAGQLFGFATDKPIPAAFR